jgi:hypothetical protein
MNSDQQTRHQITFRDQREYLWVSVSGPWNTSVLEEYIIEVRQSLAKLGYQLVLVDNQELIHPREASFERYKVGEIIVREWGSSIKAAAVAKPQDVSRYTELIATNKGAHLKVFLDLRGAITWLLSGPLK